MKDARPGRLYTGHGPHLEDGTAVISDYIRHRMIRVDQCRALVTDAGPEELWTLESITRAVYTDSLPEHLIPPAMSNTAHVLRKLQADGLLNNIGTEAQGAWRLAVASPLQPE